MENPLLFLMRRYGIYISAIVILFIAGLEITPREFMKGGVSPLVFFIFGFRKLESLLVATALTATSIAISVQVLTELGKMQSKEARLILGATVDDILAIAALSVVTTMVQTGNTQPDILNVTFLCLRF